MAEPKQEASWLTEQLKDLANQQPQFEDRALLSALIPEVQDLAERREQLAGEIDGRSWSFN
ncbi:hypothetical protein [Furfurilactobacillus milii]|uniref:hypothetical protein n=1 Tax=Furfurilactobacillus milii TaxID=2888272 RepID=UPI001EE31F21|nr:hypothetical protein [Furfurilactobacillus milii]